VKLTEGEQALTEGKYFRGKQGLDCYLKYWKGEYIHGDIEDTMGGSRIAENDCDVSRYPMVYVLMGWVYQSEYYLKPLQVSIEKGIEMAQKPCMDDSIQPHTLVGLFLYTKKGV